MKRHKDLCEFKARLVYRASSRTGTKATEKPCLEKNKNKTNKPKRWLCTAQQFTLEPEISELQLKDVVYTWNLSTQEAQAVGLQSPSQFRLCEILFWRFFLKRHSFINCLDSPPPPTLVFPDRVSLWSLGCPGTLCVIEAGLQLTEIHLPLPPDCWDWRHVLPPPALCDSYNFCLSKNKNTKTGIGLGCQGVWEFMFVLYK